MNGLQQCVGGLIAYGVSHIHSPVLKSWQILFLMLGSITLLWACFVLWWLPDSPIRAKCWSEEDRRLIVERVRANETGIQNKEWKKYQFHEAIKDPKVWCLVTIAFTNALPTGGLGAFQNLILQSFGYTTLQVDLLAIAQGVIIIFVLFSAALVARWTNQKLVTAFLFTLPNVAGTIVFLIVPAMPSTRVGLLIAFYCCQAWGGVNILYLAVMSGNVAGRTKQVVATSLVFVAWAGGNAIGPQVFRANDAPRYRKGFAVHIVLYAIQLVTIIALRFYLMWQNKKKQDALKATRSRDENIAPDPMHRHAFDDLTDNENPDFCYVY